jgi:hypothetical protein
MLLAGAHVVVTLVIEVPVIEVVPVIARDPRARDEDLEGEAQEKENGVIDVPTG